MARPKAGAWYRAGRDAWYATVNGRAIALGVKGEGNRLAAQEAYFKLLSGGRPTRQRLTPLPTEIRSRTVGELTPAFLADAELRLAANTVRIYRYDLERFAGTFGKTAVRDVTPEALIVWLRSLPVGDATKRIAVTSVSAFFGWCVRCGHRDDNPFRRVTKPRARSRAAAAVIGPDEHAKLLAAASEPLRNVLLVLHGTGCRPGEACGITAENFDAANGVATLTDHKTANRTGRPRFVFVPPAVASMLSSLAAEVRTGPLLRTARGNPWTSRAITERMKALAKRTGIKKFAYGYRHTFVTDALSTGTSEAITAALVGHTSTAVLHQFYSHLTGQADAMRKALATVRGEPAPPHKQLAEVEAIAATTAAAPAAKAAEQPSH